MTRLSLFAAALLLGVGVGFAAGVVYAHAAMNPHPHVEVSQAYDGTLLAGRAQVVSARLERASRARKVYEAELQAHASFGAALTGEAVRRRDVHREQIRSARATAAARVPVGPPASGGDVWQRLAMCESGGRNVNTGNGYYGYFQFLPSTWRSVGGPGMPHHHDYATQRHYAQVLQARSGWGQWPACARKLGLR